MNIAAQSGSSTHTFKVTHEDLLPLEVPSTPGQSPGGAQPGREKASQPRAELVKGSTQLLLSFLAGLRGLCAFTLKTWSATG